MHGFKNNMRQRKSSKFIILSLILLISFPLANAQSIRAQAEVDSLRALIGSPIPLTLTIEHLAEMELELPQYRQGDKIGDLEILSLGERQVKSVGNYQRSILKMQITSFDSGYVYLPAQKITAKPNDGGSAILASTDSILLRFDLPVIDTTQTYKPIKDIYEVPLSFADIWPWAAGALVLTAIIFGLVLLFKRLNRKEEVSKPKAPPLPPHEIAMRKLSQLEAAKYWQNGQAREYYFELSYILREYIEGRFKVPALESTTDNILRELKASIKTDSLRTKLQGMLQMAELAKFAKFTPREQENLDNMNLAREFVKRTQITKEEIAAAKAAEELEGPENE
ncbi:MAG: hypothetical protein AAFN10_05450 [Bacteroidota bacterium]